MSSIINGKRKLSADEQTDFYRIGAAVSVLEALKPWTMTRIAGAKGAKGMLNGARGSLKRLIELYLKTVPPEQFEMLQRNNKRARFRVVIGPDRQGTLTKDDGYWVSLEDLNTLANVAREQCICCMKDAQERRQCPLQKVFDKLPCPNADYDDDDCPYYHAMNIKEDDYDGRFDFGSLE